MSIITVAICTYNRSDLLERTFDRMQELAVPAGSEWELLVVNNACTDDTDAVLGRWTGRLPLRRVFEPKPGQSAARNCALREGRGDLILWTDDDVLVDREWMRALTRGLRTQATDLVFGRSVPHWLGEVPNWFSPLHHGRFAILDYGDEPFVATDLSRTFYGLNFGAVRDTLRRLGGFDESVGFGPDGGMGGDDLDLFRRALAAQLRMLYVPEAVVEHMIPAARGTKAFYRQRVESSVPREYDLLHEHFPGVPWVAGLPRFLFRQAAADAVHYVISQGTRAHDRVFHYELKLRRFAGFLRAARRRQIDTHVERQAS
jgi:glucosyl-dolichyl phosphate glucuronosyltransferase